MNRNHILHLIFSVFLLGNIGAQTIHPPEPVILYWGKNQYRLFRNQYQNNAYSGQFAISKEDLVTLSKESFYFQRKKETLKVEGMNCYFMGKDNDFNNLGFVPGDNMHFIMDDGAQGAMISKIGPGARVFINAVKANAPSSHDIPISNIQFTVSDTSQPFKSPIQITQNEISESETFSWQMVEDDEGKILMRGDTNDASMKKFTKYYGKNSKYSFMHIPGFKTLHRIVGPAYRTSPIGAEDRVIVKNKPVKDIWLCNDFIATNNHAPFYLEWGQIQLRNYAHHSYQPDYFTTNTKGSPLKVNVKDVQYDIAQMDVTIYYPDNKTVRLIGDGNMFMNWTENLSLTTKNQLFVIEDILVKDKDGSLARFPYAFIVKIE